MSFGSDCFIYFQLRSRMEQELSWGLCSWCCTPIIRMHLKKTQENLCQSHLHEYQQMEIVELIIFVFMCNYCAGGFFPFSFSCFFFSFPVSEERFLLHFFSPQCLYVRENCTAIIIMYKAFGFSFAAKCLNRQKENWYLYKKQQQGRGEVTINRIIYFILNHMLSTFRSSEGWIWFKNVQHAHRQQGLQILIIDLPL